MTWTQMSVTFKTLKHFSQENNSVLHTVMLGKHVSHKLVDEGEEP